MENIFPLLSDIRRPFDSNAVHDTRGCKVVTISSHSAWAGQHAPTDDGEHEIAVDTVQLTRIFHEVLERVRLGPVLSMDDESVTVGQMIDQLWRRFTLEDTPVRLSHVLRSARSERAVICTFLALLELVRLQAILLRQDRKFGDISMMKNSSLTG
jgi:chromatin segregation and condensation protein Rec8/ScpA/Scc1 (kleisin family)